MPWSRAVLLLALVLSACGGKATSVAPALAKKQDEQPSKPESDARCPKPSAGKVLGRVQGAMLDEISGLAASRAHAGLLWVHNDSGDSARVFALRETGELVLELRLWGAGAVDFEDIAVGPGPEPGKSYLYVGDIGDNFARRARVFIYRVEEPATIGPDLVQRASAHQLQVTYEDGAHDAESLFVDPRTGDLYIVAKAALFSSDDAPVAVYRIEQAQANGSRAVAKRVAEVKMGPATAADILPDGSGIAIRNYEALRFWPRTAQESVAEALASAPCSWPLSDDDEQGEALGFRADGLGYYTIAEGKQRPVYRHAIAR